MDDFHPLFRRGPIAMKITSFCILGLWVGFFLAAVTMAKDEKKEGLNTDLLIGKWEATDKEQKGLTLEFTKKGTIKGRFQRGDYRLDVTGKYKLVTREAEGKTHTFMELTLTDPKNKNKITMEMVKIDSLSRNELVLRGLFRRIPEKYRRVK
jgi:uncharacterized protein (TIGR03066 family)